MKQSAVITTRVSADTAAILDRIAAGRGQTRSAYVARVVEEAARREAEFLGFVQAGIDSLDKGMGIPHDDAMRELDAMVGRLEARCGD